MTEPDHPRPTEHYEFPPYPSQSEPLQPYPHRPEPLPAYEQPYGHPYGLRPPEHPQGTTVLLLGLLGVFVAGICAPFAWYLGSRALREGREAGIVYANQQSLVIGRMLGIVMTVLALAGIVFLLVFFLIVVMTAVASSS